MKFENTIVINKSAKEIFTYLANLERLPEWNYAIRRTAKVTQGAAQIGARYVQERTLPRHMTEELEITAYQQDALLEVSGGFGSLPVGKSTYRLEPMSDRKTVLQNEIELEVRGLLQFAAPLVSVKLKAAVRQNLGVLKEIIEAKRSA